VAYLDDDPLWAGSWHLAYWNPKIALVSVLDSTPSGVRPDNATAFPQSDGEMLDQNAEPLPQRVVLAPSTMTLVGRRLAHAVQGGDEPGLTLWSTPAAPRLQTWTHGVLPDPVTVDVYRCTGALEFTVAARSGHPDVLISVGNLAPAILALPPGRRVRLHVPATPLITSYACRYTIRTDGDVMVTGLRFKRANVPPGQAGPTTKVARVGSTPVPGYIPSTTPLARPKLAYCVDGDFQMLPAANRPGATQAVVVEGTGLTCSVPEGYVQQGYASDGVPPGIYPLYVPPAG
jgi:hypothetical protein